MQIPTPRRTWLLDHLNALPYPALFSLWGLTIVTFAGIYTTLSYFPGNGPTGLDTYSLPLRFANALYYSVITATNTGYGDIVPLGLSRFFAGFQSIMELFLFALFVAKLVANRQDVALQEVHKIAFELTFRNIREDLFVARKDFDHIIEVVRVTHTLSQSDWERLAVAFQHINGLLREIPDFYDVTSDLYVIDPRREALLLEAVQRTVVRITNTLETLSEAHIDWKSNAESVSELKELQKALNSIIPLWRTHSHDQSHDAFDHIARSQEKVRALISA